MTSDVRRVSPPRKVMEGQLGRHLVSGEVVHHIDGNRFDHNPENLLLCTTMEHVYLHCLQREANPSCQQRVFRTLQESRRRRVKCPECKARTATKAGFIQFSPTKRVQRYQCQDCGKMFRKPKKGES